MSRSHAASALPVALACGALLASLLGGFCPPVAAESPATVHVYIFMSEDCPHCDLIKEPALSRLANRTGCTIIPQYFDVENLENYKLLVLLERKHNDTGNDLPVVFVGGHVLGGVQEIENGLENTVRKLAQSGGAAPVPLPSAAEIEKFFSSGGNGPAIHMAYFEQPGCRQCQRVEHMLRHWERQWPALNIKRLSIARRENKILLEALGERAHVPEEKRLLVPALFAGTDVLIGREITDENLAGLLRRYAAQGSSDPCIVDDVELAAARDRLVKRSQTLGLTAVLAGGLVDGINPCAFATVVFLVTYLTGLGRSRGRILVAGVSFCGGVFLGYFVMGIGLSELMFQFRAMPVVAAILRWSIIALVSVLALLSFYDAWVSWRGQPKAMLLKIPSRLRARMVAITSRQFRSSRLVPASLFLGLVLSLIEFVCTGQVYLPLIQLTLSLSVDRLQTLGLLLAYNAAFCAPLLLVFLAAFLGASSERLNAFLLGHITPAKVLLGVFFTALAATLVLVG